MEIIATIENWVTKNDADRLKQPAQEFVKSYLSMIKERLIKVSTVHDTNLEMYTDLYTEKNKLMQKIDIFEGKSMQHPS